jgi:hypothetical protein
LAVIAGTIRFEIEITEGVLIDDFERAIATLRQIKNLGVRVAMDDSNPSPASRSARTHSSAGERILLQRGARLLFLVLSLQKLNINLRAVDADKFASPISQTGRR